MNAQPTGDIHHESPYFSRRVIVIAICSAVPIVAIAHAVPEEVGRWVVPAGILCAVSALLWQALRRPAAAGQRSERSVSVRVADKVGRVES